MLQRRKFSLGIRQKPTSEVTTLEGESRVASEDMTFKAYLDGAERTVATTDQVQTLTNKSIDADTNTISNLTTANLDPSSLIIDISTATSDTEIPSALAVKTALEGQNEAAEIAYDPSDSSLTQTNVKTSLDEVAGRLDTNETDISNTSTGLSNHLADTDAHTASDITNVASGNLVATDVQSALDELQTELDGVNSNATNNTTNLNNHINNASDAHDASAISNVPTGNLIATNAQDALNELQSDVDTRALDSDLTDHISDTSTHGVAGDIVGTSDQQILTNKDIDGGTASDNNRITLPKETKANLDSLTRKEGTIVYATDDQSAYLDNGTNLIPVGSGSGGDINHLGKNGDADNGIGDWNSNVVLGSTIVVSETDPLRGSSSFLVRDNASGTSGDFSVLAACVFNLENADLTQKQYISFDFEKVSATFGEDQDLTIVIRQNGNSERVFVINDTVDGRDGQYLMSFDPTDVLSYRLELVRNVTNSTGFAMSFKIDNIRIAPREITKSIGKTSWTGSFDDSLDVNEYINEGNVLQSVTRPATGLYNVYYNKGRFPSEPLVTAYINSPDEVSPSVSRLAGFGSDGTGDFVRVRTISGGSSVNLSGTDQLQVTFTQKEEDQTAYQISTDLGNREIYTRAVTTSGFTVNGTETKVDFDSTERDTIGAFDAVNNRIIIAEKATYNFNFNWIMNPTSSSSVSRAIVNIYNSNNVLIKEYEGLTTSINTTSLERRAYISDSISLNTGDYFEVTMRYFGFGGSLTNTITSSSLTVTKQSNDAPMLGVTAPQIAIFKDVKPSGTAGGTATAGSYLVRDLNTQEGLYTFASLDSNEITLEKGKYLISFSAPAYDVARHKAKIVSISGDTVEILGSSMFAIESSNNMNNSLGQGSVTLTNTTVIQLQHRVSITRSGNGFGVESSFGDDEVYSIVKIQKIY